MDDHAHKLNPFQGIALLFFLLAIPVGIYFYQTQNVGETRSQAGNTCPVCPAGMTAFLGPMRDGVRSCGCKPIPGYVAPVVATATPIHTPIPTEYISLTSAPIRIITERPLPTLTPIPTPTIIPMLLAELLSLSPTPLPLLMQQKIAAPILTIDPFYNAKKQTNPTLSLSGTSDPVAELDISISPEGIITTVTADTLGNWQFTIPKKLTNGEKQLTIISRTAKGGQMTKTDTFIVVGGFQFPFAAVIFSLLIALGAGGYIFYQKKMSASQLPPPETSTPTTTAEFQQPEPTLTEEQPTIQSIPQEETPSVPETSSTLPVESNQTEPPPTTTSETV